MPGKQLGADRAVAPGTVVRSGKPMAHGKPQPTQGWSLEQPGYGETAYAEAKGEYSAPTRAEQAYEANQKTYTSPGAGERAAGDIGSDFRKGAAGDSAGQQYWEGVAGKYQNGGPGYSTDAYKQFGANVDPGLDKYYDAAFNKTEQRLDRGAASRGMYGSSYAMDNVREAGVQLGAEQANREADYRLRRQQALEASARGASQEELGWTQGMGELAFGAGNERLDYGQAAIGAGATGQQLEQGRVAQGHDAAMGVDQLDLANRNAGMEAAFAAQDAREGRVQGRFDNQIALGDRYASGYGGAVAADAEAAAQQVATALGMSQEEFERNRAEIEASYNEWIAGMQTMAASSPMSKVGGAAPGGGGGGNAGSPSPKNYNGSK